MKNARQLNGIALAYMGDAVYEIYVRTHLLEKGLTKPTRLQQVATHYVSAKAQAALIILMVQEDYLTAEELEIYKRGRNAKSYTKAKNTSVTTYRSSTGFEAIFGYLHLTQQTDRVQTLANWCIQKVEEGKVDEIRTQ